MSIYQALAEGMRANGVGRDDIHAALDGLPIPSLTALAGGTTLAGGTALTGGATTRAASAAPSTWPQKLAITLGSLAVVYAIGAAPGLGTRLLHLYHDGTLAWAVAGAGGIAAAAWAALGPRLRKRVMEAATGAGKPLTSKNKIELAHALGELGGGVPGIGGVVRALTPSRRAASPAHRPRAVAEKPRGRTPTRRLASPARRSRAQGIEGGASGVAAAVTRFLDSKGLGVLALSGGGSACGSVLCRKLVTASLVALLLAALGANWSADNALVNLAKQMLANLRTMASYVSAPFAALLDSVYKALATTTLAADGTRVTSLNWHALLTPCTASSGNGSIFAHVGAWAFGSGPQQMAADLCSAFIKLWAELLKLVNGNEIMKAMTYLTSGLALAKAASVAGTAVSKVLQLLWSIVAGAAGTIDVIARFICCHKDAEEDPRQIPKVLAADVKEIGEKLSILSAKLPPSNVPPTSPRKKAVSPTSPHKKAVSPTFPRKKVAASKPVTLTELRARARAAGARGYGRMTRQQLHSFLSPRR